MLRTDRKAGFVTEGAWFWKRHRFRAARLTAARALGPRALAELEQLQREQPVALIEAEGRQWWWYRDCFYWEDDGLGAHDVMALVVERERRKQRKLERAHAAMQQELNGSPRREPIPRDVRLAVWRRDGGALRRVRQRLRAPVRPRDPVLDGRSLQRREPAAALRGLQPREGRRALTAQHRLQAGLAALQILAIRLRVGTRARVAPDGQRLASIFLSRRGVGLLIHSLKRSGSGPPETRSTGRSDPHMLR